MERTLTVCTRIRLPILSLSLFYDQPPRRIGHRKLSDAMWLISQTLRKLAALFSIPPVYPLMRFPETDIMIYGTATRAISLSFTTCKSWQHLADLLFCTSLCFDLLWSLVFRQLYSCWNANKLHLDLRAKNLAGKHDVAAAVRGWWCIWKGLIWVSWFLVAPSDLYSRSQRKGPAGSHSRPGPSAPSPPPVFPVSHTSRRL